MEIKYNEPIEEYHKNQAVSTSKLNTFLKSPKTFYYDYFLGRRHERPLPTCVSMEDHFAFGSMVHCIIGEGYEEFEKRYVLKPGKMDRRTKAGKEAFDYWIMGINGRLPVDLTAYEAAEGMFAAVKEMGWLSRLLEKGTPEVTIRGEVHGLNLQCRPDLLIQNITDDEICNQLGIPNGGSIILDIKTTNQYDNFRHSIKSFKYHRQAAFYLYLAKEAGLSINKFIFLAIDKNMPYDYSIIELGEETLKMGTVEILEGLNRMREFYADPLAVLKRDVHLETIDLDPPSLF